MTGGSKVLYFMLIILKSAEESNRNKINKRLKWAMGNHHEMIESNE